MLEKRLIAVPPQSFVTNGSADGTITVADTKFFKVKQEVVLSATSLPNLDTIEVKRVMSPTQLAVGPKTGNIDTRSDVSAYTTALGAAIFAIEQKRPSVPFEEVTRAVYEEEPTVAERVIAVDQYGRKIDSVVDANGKVRLAVDGTFTAEVDVQVDVDVDGFYDAATNPDPDNIAVIGHTRVTTPGQVQQVQRITAVQGSVDTTNRSLDVSVHDMNGNGIASDFGAVGRGLRVNAIPGNAAGIADFAAGTTTAQTQRVTANITRNGTELSYNDGTSDANTIRTSSNVKFDGTTPALNSGANNALTQRVVANIQRNGNELSYNAGTSDANTQRVTANITRNGTELSYNSGTNDANTQRVASNIQRQGNELDYNFGALSGNTLRTASIPGNAAGIADFNNGITGAQTPRVTANITRNGTELSYNNGASDANTIRTASNLNTSGTPLTSTLVGTKQSLDVNIPAFVSTLNSTTANLGIGGTFIGTGEDILDFAEIEVQVFTNQASAALGFRPQYSVDNVNWDDGDAYTLPAMAAGAGSFFTFPRQARFFRINYTNGGVAQTQFRLSVIYSKIPTKTSSHRIADVVLADTDGEMQIAINKARKPDLSYDDLTLNTINELKTIDILNTSIISAEKTSTTTASIARVGGSSLANRKVIEIINTSTVALYVGPSTVTTTGANRGRPIGPNASFAIDLASNIDLYIISASSATYVVVEVS